MVSNFFDSGNFGGNIDVLAKKIFIKSKAIGRFYWLKLSRKSYHIPLFNKGIYRDGKQKIKARRRGFVIKRINLGKIGFGKIVGFRKSLDRSNNRNGLQKIVSCPLEKCLIRIHNLNGEITPTKSNKKTNKKPNKKRLYKRKAYENLGRENHEEPKNKKASKNTKRCHKAYGTEKTKNAREKKAFRRNYC